MIGELSFQYPTWYLVFCIVLGLIFSSFLYYRDEKFKEQNSWLIYFLAFLRFVLVTGIAILLLSPLIKTIKEETKKPIVLLAKDLSQSVGAEMSTEEQIAFSTNFSELEAKLSASYDVVSVGFGANVSTNVIDSFPEQSTNLSTLINYVSDNYGDQNLGAVVLASDGIYNEGRDPRYLTTGIKAPIYTIALGDTTRRRDLLVKNVYHNKIAYLGDKFTIQADIQGFNSNNQQSNLTLQRMNGGSNPVLSNEQLNIDKEDYFVTKDFVVDADQVGVLRYRLGLSPISNEVTTSNNYKNIYVEVLDSRQKILLLANAPHPDLTALKSIISSNKNYEVEIAYAKEGVTNLEEYSLVFLHNLPSAPYKIEAIIAQMNKLKLPRIFIVGAQIEASSFNRLQDVIAFKGGGSSLEDIQATINKGFNAYILDADKLNKLSIYPPLIAPFGEYALSGPSSSVFTQRIKKIDTDYPLLSFQDKDGFKTGVLVGEGLWRWRLFNFMKDNNYDVVTELVNKAVQYVAVKEDKRKFRGETNKKVYKENESVVLEAQLYNDSYEMINDPDVFLKIINSEGKEYSYTLSRNNQYYSLDAGLFPPGAYRYFLNSNYAGKVLELKGQFSVQEIELEQFDLTARHDILQQLAAKSGGTLYYPEQFEDLTTNLLERNKLKPVIYQSTKTKSVIHLKWLFGLFLSFLSIEWFLRRYFGYY